MHSRAGSLEALVEQARWRNIALSGGILLLILATVGSLVRFSRKAQQMADLQMNFVAGVSHELRTPLTIIRTAAFNLRTHFSDRPAHVERYGRLIESESAIENRLLRRFKGECGVRGRNANVNSRLFRHRTLHRD